MMILRAYTNKMAFGLKSRDCVSFIAVILAILISSPVFVAAKDYGVGNSRVDSRISSQVRSNIGTMKGPPSGVSSGLTPRPTDRQYYERNLAITGNVASGREFKGSVPYRSTSDFLGRLGSDDLNSFIRNSSRTPYHVRSSGGYQPYYLPSRTVTSTRRGAESGLTAPVITPQSYTPVYKPLDISKRYQLPLAERTMERRIRPFGYDTDEMALRLKRKTERDDLQIVDELLFNRDRAAEIKRILREFEESESKKFEAEVQKELKMKEAEPKAPEPKLFWKEEITGEQEKKPAPETERKSLEAETEELRKYIREKLGVTPPEERAKEEKDPLFEDKPQKPDQEPEEKEKLEDLIHVDHKRAQELLGEHKDYDSLANAKFAAYRKLAADFMKEGKYYDARDAWKLAEIWIIDHPDISLGMGNALFAAGEYLSSVYYIERTMAYSLDHAKKKTDLFKFVDAETINSRMEELTRIHGHSKSYKLGFLLAHLHYQADELDKAAEYLVTIKQQMNKSLGYHNLKKAVEAAIAREGEK